jgi:hypothetical protein
MFTSIDIKKNSFLLLGWQTANPSDPPVFMDPTPGWANRNTSYCGHRTLNSDPPGCTSTEKSLWNLNHKSTESRYVVENLCHGYLTNLLNLPEEDVMGQTVTEPGNTFSQPFWL